MASMIKQVTNLETSLQLKKAGIMQETNFGWYDDGSLELISGGISSPNFVCAAFTFQEVQELMGYEYYTTNNFDKAQEYLSRLINAEILDISKANQRLKNFYAKEPS